MRCTTYNEPVIDILYGVLYIIVNSDYRKHLVFPSLWYNKLSVLSGHLLL